MAHITHTNAKPTPTGRLELARCVVEDKWPLRRAAERFQVAVTTAKRWAGRYRALARAPTGPGRTPPPEDGRRRRPGRRHPERERACGPAAPLPTRHTESRPGTRP